MSGKQFEPHYSVKDIGPSEEVFSDENIKATVTPVEWETGPQAGEKGYMARVDGPDKHQTGTVLPTKEESEQEALEMVKQFLEAC